MNWLHEYIGKGFEFEDVSRIERFRVTLVAPWATGVSLWLVLFCAMAAAVAIYFYAKGQTSAKKGARIGLGICRALVLVLLVIMLAEPVLEAEVSSTPRPMMYVMIDGTDSMAIRDDLPEGERDEMITAVGYTGETDERLSRAQYVEALLSKEEDNLLEKLSEKFRLKAFLIDRPGSLRSLELHEPGEEGINPAHIASQISTDGQVTALGSMFSELDHRQGTNSLAGVLLFSDFAQNAGPAPTGTEHSPVNRLRAPVFTVGLGATGSKNVSLELEVPPRMKKAEGEVIEVRVHQDGLDGRSVTVKVTARRIDESNDGAVKEIHIGDRTVELPHRAAIEFPFVPEDAGRYEFTAEIQPIDDEVVTEDNRAVRLTNIREDFLRLTYVAYEPSWEWRFVKEVFHRDKLVTMEGFRTFLRSADVQVKMNNPLFLPNLTLPRKEFFQTDVIFLGDMPAASLSPEYCEMVKEFVGDFGGGLVVIAGPRFGPGELAETAIGDMLPVVVEPGLALREGEFVPKRTAYAGGFEFMRLAEDDLENEEAWENMGELSWYQPVARPSRKAGTTVLMEHPTDKCPNTETPQPLIAIRQYGKGRVIYLAFDEMWRLRRNYGELHYTQFWGSMIKKLALSHSLGADKRFVAGVDKDEYRVDEKVMITIDAYDEEYKLLTEDKVANRKLEGTIEVPGRTADAPVETKPLSIPLYQPGKFQLSVPVYTPGTYRARIKDPVTEEMTTITFEVSDASIERRQAERNVTVEQDIVLASGGKQYTLKTVGDLADEIKIEPRIEMQIHRKPLWNTTAAFVLLCALMLGEWLFRKLNNMP